MKKIAILSIVVSIFLWGSPALATALKSLDSGIIFNLNYNIFDSEPALMLIIGTGMLSIAGFTRRKIKR